MKERPVLFCTPMALATIGDSKTQTRRLVGLPEGDWRHLRSRDGYALFARAVRYDMGIETVTEFNEVACKLGKPGDLLWVRETHYRFGHWEPVPGVKTKQGRMKWKFVEDNNDVLFDPPPQFRSGRHSSDPATPAWHKRPSLFMPRSASRITLEITGIRVERLAGITPDDCLSEGCLPDETAMRERHDRRYALFAAFHTLWESINGRGSFDANPWVWVIEFRRIA